MEPKIYIDIVFPVTWGMDAFLLWMAGRILGPVSYTHLSGRCRWSGV